MEVDQHHSPGDNETRIIGKLVFHLYLYFGYNAKGYNEETIYGKYLNIFENINGK